jgi:hypothetical protein
MKPQDPNADVIYEQWKQEWQHEDPELIDILEKLNSLEPPEAPSGYWPHFQQTFRENIAKLPPRPLPFWSIQRKPLWLATAAALVLAVATLWFSVPPKHPLDHLNEGSLDTLALMLDNEADAFVFCLQFSTTPLPGEALPEFPPEALDEDTLLFEMLLEDSLIPSNARLKENPS